MGGVAKANAALLKAVLEPREPGALEQIATACAAGADPDGITPETSTSRGFVHGGSSLLTHSVREEASFAVKALLAAGADPNLTDENGWTPWMASSLIDESKQRKIREALTEAGATPNGEHVGALARALFAGDLSAAQELVESPDDLRVLATFRVDLLGRALSDRNDGVARFLLEGGMPGTSTHLSNAIRNEYMAGVDLLLKNGVVPDEDGETDLMTAAGLGSLPIVERLVDAGANVNRYAHDDPMWTASHYAAANGHDDVAAWLIERMDADVLQQQAALKESRKGPFSQLYDHATGGEGVTTDDIVAALTRWNDANGLALGDVADDSLTVTFHSLPARGDALYAELLALCPDLSDTAESPDELHDVLAADPELTLWWD